MREARLTGTAAELIQQGYAEGRREMFVAILAGRFDVSSSEIAGRVGAADDATLDRWCARSVTATTLDEVLSD